MAVGAFPIAKLAALAMRQLSKPLANKLKFYHWCEVNIKMRLLNLGKPSAVKPLKEVEAIDLGAELLGECIIFSIAAGSIVAEYIRQARNAKADEDMKEDRYHRLTHDMEDLQIVVSRQEAEIRHLSRILGARPHQIVPEVPVNPHARKEASTYVSLDEAVHDAKQMLGKSSQSAGSVAKTSEETRSSEKKN